MVEGSPVRHYSRRVCLAEKDVAPDCETYHQVCNPYRVPLSVPSVYKPCALCPP